MKLKYFLFMILIIVLMSGCNSSKENDAIDEPYRVDQMNEPYDVEGDASNDVKEIDETNDVQEIDETNPDGTYRIEENVPMEKEVTIGDTKNTGVSVKVPENSLDEDVKISLSTISMKENTDEGYEILGKAFSVNVSDKEAVRLFQPAQIKVSIPPDQLVKIESEDDIFAAYYNKNQWEYFKPDHVDLEAGIIEFTTYHFSPYASGKLSREKQLEHFAKQMAVQSWSKDQMEKAFTDATKEYFYDLFENKLEITDEDVKGKILRSIIKEKDFGDLIINIEKGDMTGFSTKLGEMTGKVILNQSQLDPAFMSKWVSITSTGAKTAGHLLEGDYTQAMKEISLAIMDQHIIGKIFKAGIEVTDSAIKDWKEKSIEDAFQAYKNGSDGSHGYYVDAGDFNALTNQMRGIMHKIYTDYTKVYCSKNNLDVNKLDEATISIIRKEAESQLENQFNKRLSDEAMIQEHRNHHMKIIRGFENNLLLKKGSFGYDDDTTLERRIERLYIVMENILNQIDMKLNVYLVDSTDEEISLDDLCTLIGAWYNDRSETKEVYFEKLREMGFLKTKVDEPIDEEYRWVLVDIIDNKSEEFISSYNEREKDNKKLEANYASSNFMIKWTYTGKTITSYDPHMVHGESIAFVASFTKPPEVIRANETIPIILSLSSEGNSLSFFTPFASVRGQIGKNNSSWMNFENEDGKVTFKSDSKNNYATFNETITAVAPIGMEGDRLELRFQLYHSAKLETAYVYEWQRIGD